MEKARCAVCRTSKGDLKTRGPVILCRKHFDPFMWDTDEEYLRKKKRGGKWDKIWPSQGNLARAFLKLGYVVDQEVMPLWSVSPKGALMPFDMAIPELRVLVEYNGKQHEKFNRYFFRNRTLWRAYKARDRMKKRLAKGNGWTVIVFTEDDKPFTGKKLREKLDGN